MQSNNYYKDCSALVYNLRHIQQFPQFSLDGVLVNQRLTQRFNKVSCHKLLPSTRLGEKPHRTFKCLGIEHNTLILAVQSANTRAVPTTHSNTAPLIFLDTALLKRTNQAATSYQVISILKSIMQSSDPSLISVHEDISFLFEARSLLSNK